MKTLYKLKPGKDPVRGQVSKSSMCVNETVIHVVAPLDFSILVMMTRW